MPENPKLAWLRAEAAKLPLQPGVYIMKDAQHTIIYIGKAKQLRNRVGQYFARAAKHPPKVEKMVEHVDHFDYIIVDSEFEALVLESSLIKQHKPKYNILLKDDKGYHYLRVSLNELYPRITVCHAKDKRDDGATYLGPYTSSYLVREAADEACKAFRLAVCNRRLPQDIGKDRPCLNYHIGQCSGPCANRISQQEYHESAENAFAFLKGGNAGATAEMTRKMHEAAENLEFEKAARYRDTIAILSRIAARPKVVDAALEDADVIALAQLTGRACFQVFSIREHRLTDREEFLLDGVEPEDAPALRAEFLQSYYSMREAVPHVVLLDALPEDAALLERFLSQKAGRKVTLRVPQKGEGLEFVRMAENNAVHKLQNSLNRTDRSWKAVGELAVLLGLPDPPHLIESYDISNTAGSDMVAAMVVFRDGRPDKSRLRRFKIQTLADQDDPAAMAEVVERSLRRRLPDGDRPPDEKFGELPDLILLDGGKTQVAAVRRVLDSLGLSIPLFGMVKDSRHRTRAIEAGGREIAIQANRSVFTLVSSIQEEVHRAAIGYHHVSRAKSSLSMKLTQIPGIGKERAALLLREFKTLAGIRRASVEELAAVKGMTRPAAEAVYAAFEHDDPAPPAE